MPAPQAAGGGQGDNSTAMLWMVAAVFAAIGIIWFVFRTEIVAIYLTIKLYELDILTYLGGLFKHPYYFENLRQEVISARDAAASVSYHDLGLIGNNVGKWIRLPLVVLLILLAVIVYISNTARVFKRKYNMRDFMKLESQNWPQIIPVLKLDLLKTDIETGPWAMAQTPMQFCKKQKLLEEVRFERREGMTRAERNRIEVVLKRGEANKVFALQLGPLWRGTNKLPPYVRALFAVFAARINGDSRTASKLLIQMSVSSSGKRLNVSGVDGLIKKHENTKGVQKVVKSHAYIMTVMASMLLAAREDGVQASSDFLWLKPMDRRLWYVLNTVGRQTPFIEVAGVFAHWMAEREAGRKLLLPMVEEATNAVEIALKEVVYRPDQEA